MHATQHATMLTISLACFLCFLLILSFPVEGLAAALQGLAIWWEILFPALLPFFVISEILLGIGIVHFLGTLLDPLMRPLFRVPGIGGFVMAMGLVSGYPVGARLTAQLWEQKLINKVEGERLVSFTTTTDPIFMIGAVAVGFFHNVGLAMILGLTHYGSSFIVGFIMRYYGHHQDEKIESKPQHKGQPIVSRALQAMHHARINDGRPLGQLLREAIESSLKLVFVIGGLVVFFAVLIELLTLSHIVTALYVPLNGLLASLGLSEALSVSLVNGLFEVTLGAKFAAEAAMSSMLIHQTAITSLLLSWGGLSVHAQIVSLLSHTTISYRPFLIARLLHGLLSLILVYALWDLLLPLHR